MTREEATIYIKNLREYMKMISKESEYGFIEENYIALDMAIKILEQEPCEDAVSRTEAIRLAEQGQIQGFEWQIRKLVTLPSVTPTQRWISVSEELPKSDDDVLVTNGKGMYIGWIDPTDKRWRVDSESEYYMENVVAWMPLPKLYKKETDV